MTVEPATARPLNGAEYLESLRDGRQIYIHGDKVADVTTHPAFRNSARMMARLFDALHDPKHKDVLTTETDTGSGGYTHAFFKAPHSAADLVAGRDAIAAWQRLTYGWMGRSPDYKAAFLATFGPNADYYAPFADNARRWYSEAQERVWFMNHTLVNPPVDRDKQIHEVPDVFIHRVKELVKYRDLIRASSRAPRTKCTPELPAPLVVLKTYGRANDRSSKSIW
jgi:4-hydroxyphenylacetate 3-monooxygenase